MIIKKNNKEGKWCKFDKGVEFRLRLFKYSKLNLEIEETTEGLIERFLYCVEDWKGIFEEDGKTPLKCNSENKINIFDYYRGVREFVFTEIIKMELGMGKAVKN